MQIINYPLARCHVICHNIMQRPFTQIYICYMTLTNSEAVAIISQSMSEALNWESTYAIALALRQTYPQVELESVSLGQVYLWTIALPGFDDDPALANDSILAAIYQDWLEETLHDH